MANGYADGTDTQALLNELGGVTLTLGEASTPTLAQVGGWLDEYAAMVDVRLTARGYTTVPATGTNDVLLIGHYVTQRAAARAWNAGFIVDELPAKIKTWIAEWDDFLTSLDKGRIRLINQAPRNRAGTIRGAVYIKD